MKILKSASQQINGTSQNKSQVYQTEDVQRFELVKKMQGRLSRLVKPLIIDT